LNYLFDPHITINIKFHIAKEGEFYLSVYEWKVICMDWHENILETNRTNRRCIKKADDNVHLESRVDWINLHHDVLNLV